MYDNTAPSTLTGMYQTSATPELIEKRLQQETTEGRILFSSPALNEFFKTSNFELNLQTGEVLTYLDPQRT